MTIKHFPLIPTLLACATTLSGQTAITVYNGNFGVVRETVPLDLIKGISEQSYSGVTSQLEPESVILRDPRGQIALSIVELRPEGLSYPADTPTI